MSSVTLIVPVYNVQQWLSQCVDSIMRQTISDWRLILVDDGSTDKSSEICDSYAAKDGRISVIHKQNGGLSSARNAGLDVATSEFVIFIDSDDEVHPELISHLLTMQTATGADICSGNTVYQTNYKFKPIVDERFDEYTPEKAIETTLYQRNGLLNSAWNKLYKRELFDGLRFTEGIGYEDLDIFYKVYARANKFAYSRQVTYLYRANPTSYINTWSKSRLDVLTVVDKIVDYMAENGNTTLQQAAADRRFSANFNIFNLATINHEQGVADKCWQVIRERRISELVDSRVRAKNKIGAFTALFGRKFTELIIKIL
jgi:glycosyltransferase involved in cell wall biosynthesis